MRRLFPIVLLSIFCSVVIADAEPQLQQDRAKLCIDRPGEMGRVNVEPVTIRLRNGEELTIYGEEEVCLIAFPDELTTISLRFPFPYGPGEKPRYWKTAPVTVAVKRGATTRITLCERNNDRDSRHWMETGWHEMWALSPPESRSACYTP